MGDRCNVAIKTGAGDRDHVWLYSHWGGHEMPGRLLRAMTTQEAQSRLSDESYLCRILIDRLMNNHTEETGYGISTGPVDNEYPVIEVDVPAKMIRVRPFDFGDAWDVRWSEPPLFEESFSTFCRRERFDWADARGVVRTFPAAE
jgi:hypothetical protein